MIDKDQARRTKVNLYFNGVDVTEQLQPYFLSLTYLDVQEDEADDLQLEFMDAPLNDPMAPGVWVQSWLNQAVDAAAGRGMSIRAEIVRQNWNGDGAEDKLDTGLFELDSVDVSGPPAVVTIKCTALPFTAQFRQTEKCKAWESYNLSGIASEMAGNNGMSCMFLAASDPFYDRVEQYETTDIAFLQQLCHDAGLSLKATNQQIVVFDQVDYESKAPVKTIKRGDGSYTDYTLSTSTADTQYQSCRVWYNDLTSASVIEGIAYCDDYDSTKEGNEQLDLNRKVGSAGEAKALAEKNLRLHNKFERLVSFSMAGDTTLLAGLTIQTEDWGGWDGKSIITKAKHRVSNDGYRTDIVARRVLEGY